MSYYFESDFVRLLFVYYLLCVGIGTPWPSNNLIQSAIAVLLLGLGDHHPQCIKACVEGVQHLIEYETQNNKKTLSSLSETLVKYNVMAQLTQGNDNHEGETTRMDAIAVYAILSNELFNHQPIVQEHMQEYVPIGMAAFGGSSSSSSSSSSSTSSTKTFSPCHNIAWISMLAHRVTATTTTTTSVASTDDLDEVSPCLSLLTGYHGLTSNSSRKQRTASECLVHLCSTPELLVDFHWVGQLAKLARRYLLHKSPHVKLGGLMLLTKMVPYHFNCLNLWLVGDSCILKRVLSFMTR